MTKTINKPFYTAKNDTIFKAIFCDVNDTFLLKTLIERCLNEKMDIIKIFPPEVIKDNIYAKGKTLDLLVKTGDKIINIEINSSFYDGMHRKNFGYACQKYTENIKVGDSYKDMDEIIQLNFTWGLPKKYPEVCVYILGDFKTNILFVDNFKIYEFNMDKIKKMWYSLSLAVKMS